MSFFKSNPCATCGLFGSCKTPKMKATGEGKKKILVIAEAPGKSEDEQGIQLIGASGQLFRSHLKKIGIDLDEDCWKTNAVSCRPPGNRTPTPKEFERCKPKLFDEIKQFKPDKIITLGRIAFESLLDNRLDVKSLDRWVGAVIPDQKHKAWVFPTYHPAYLLRSEKDQSLSAAFARHLKRAFEWNDEFFITEDTELILETDLREARSILWNMDNGYLSIDFETNCLSPYVEGGKILCAAVSNGEKTVAWPVRTERDLLLIPKLKSKWIAHNLKFEDLWFRKYFNKRLNWIWDSMIAAHVIDNRRGITDLKTQTYLNFGIAGYDKESKLYKGSGRDGFNKMGEMPLQSMLEYCARDALYSYWLFERQSELMTEERLDESYRLFHEGIQAFCDIEHNGINVDIEYYERQDKRLKNKIERIDSELMDMPEVEVWNKNEKSKLNIDSNVQIKKLFYDYLKYKPLKATKKGNASIDAEALRSINTPFSLGIIKSAELKKIRSTFLANFLHSTIVNKLHPSFHLNTVSTYRSSSSDPNFQNIPKHDNFAQEVTRSGIIPSKGNFLLEVDYSGIEVRVSACYHQDPVMINYIKDKSTDMHRDTAMDLFMLNKDEVTKDIRYISKNCFVFPQFYGSYYAQCAPSLWKNALRLDLKNHLREKGIISYNDFEQHVKEIENVFWNRRFRVYSEWKRKVFESYLRTGYVELLTGFRCSGYMKKNEVLNYPIQGTAFHLLLWSLTRLNSLLQKRNYKTRVIGQIHDSILFDVNPSEESELLSVIYETMCETVRKKWKWICVPLDIEMEKSEIDGNWFDKEVIEGGKNAATS